MGWLFQDTPLRHETPAHYLTRAFSFEDEHRKVEVLAASQVGSTVYMAVRSTEKPMATSVRGYSYVFAAVILVRNNARDGFGYKDMSEAMGPCEVDCPDRIMRLLSPISEIPRPGYAADWRARVAQRKAERIAARVRTAELTPGTRLRTVRPLRFGRVEASLFEAVETPRRRRGPVFVAVGHNFLCRLRPSDIADAERVLPGAGTGKQAGSTPLHVTPSTGRQA